MTTRFLLRRSISDDPAKNGENGRNGLLAQPLQRGAEAGARLLGLGATLALLLDHLFGRARDEVRIAELGVDLADLVRKLLDLLLKPRALGLEVDHLADRQRIRRLAQHDLQRRLGRRRRRLDALDARQPLDRGAMRIEPLLRAGVGADHLQLELGSRRHVQLRACRADVGDQITSQLISASAAVSVAAGAGQGWPISMPCSARWPSLSHSSSVMNGITGCSSFTVSRSTKAVTARVSSFSAPSAPCRIGLVSSTYQSHTAPQMNS